MPDGTLELVIGPGGRRAEPPGVDARRADAADPPVPLGLGARAGRAVHDRAGRHRGQPAHRSRRPPTSPPRVDRATRWVEQSIDYWAAYVAASPRPARAQHVHAAEHAVGRRAEHRLRRRLLRPRAGRGAADRARRAGRALLELVGPPAALVRLRRVGRAADELQRAPGARRRRRQGADRRRATPTPAPPTGSTPRASRSACASTATSARARSRCRRPGSSRSPRCASELPDDHPVVTADARRAAARRPVPRRAAPLELRRRALDPTARARTGSTG